MWSFSEVGHGKGEHDRVGACVKRENAREKLKFVESAKFKDAHEIMNRCNRKLSIGSSENFVI